MPAELILKPGRERAAMRRHPWFFANAIERVRGAPAAGDTVAVRAADGRFLAWAAFSPTSTIRARAWSFDEAERIDEDFFVRRIAASMARRRTLAARTDAMRLVFGEADGLPGLIVDRYAQQLVTQFAAAGVERWRDAIVAALVACCGDVAVFDRSDVSVREREGLAAHVGPLLGPAPGPVPIVEDGVRYEVDVLAGHKTGFYLDQRDSRAMVRSFAQRMGTVEPNNRAAGVHMLNCFAYTGGFALAALAGGAAVAISVDSSAEALAQAARNAALNGFDAQRAACVQADVFEFLRSQTAAGARYDLIVLDPPKFAASAHHVDRAARAYKDINLRALSLLAPDGVLFTFSCSGAIDADLFQKIVAGAVIDAKVDCQLLHRLGAGEDHPMAMTHPEGEYLKGLCLRRI